MTYLNLHLQQKIVFSRTLTVPRGIWGHLLVPVAATQLKKRDVDCHVAGKNSICP